MPIYIAKTPDEKVQSVVLANNYELALAYWQGKGITSHVIVTMTEKDLDGHSTGVLPIVHIE